MKIFLILASLCFMAGCSLPNNVFDLKKSSILIPMYTKLSPDQTYKILMQEMNNIYSYNSLPIAVGGTVVSISGSDLVEGRKINTNHYQVTLTTKAGFSSVLGEVIDILPNENEKCQTRMDIRVLNRFWKVHANRIKKAFENKKILCSS